MCLTTGKSVKNCGKAAYRLLRFNKGPAFWRKSRPENHVDHPSCKTENQLFTCVSVAHLLLSLNNGLAVGSPCSPLLSLWWAVDTQDLLIRDFDVFCSARAVLATPQLESMKACLQDAI